ncbi:RNA-binding protein [Actinomycetota bacterium]|nr:RNA-binding protein [Actinomycetota bacterium]
MTATETSTPGSPADNGAGTATVDMARAAVIDQLQSLLLQTAGVEEFVDGVARAAAQHVGPATSVTITLRRDGYATAVSASDPGAAECDEVEYRADAGPCLESIDVGHVVRCPDIAQETRWPRWCAAALAHGYASAAAVPRALRPGTAIALNLYSTRPHAWDEAAMATAGMFADEIARSLTLALRSADQAELNADLRAALRSRALIDQAIGVIMAQNRCTADVAFGILRTASQHRNLKLRDVAVALLQGVSGAAPSEVDTFTDRRR